MIRTQISLPQHIRDRMKKFREHNNIEDEHIAIIRLLDVGLTTEENKLMEKQLENAVFQI